MNHAKQQYFVYPGHGVAELVRTEKRQLLGTVTEFMNLKIIDSGMIIMVPSQSADQVGLRPVMDKFTATKCLNVIKDKSSTRTSATIWNVRYREYMATIKSGDPVGIAEVISMLTNIKENGHLTFGERKMLDCAKSILYREIYVVLGVDVSKVCGE